MTDNVDTLLNCTITRLGKRRRFVQTLRYGLEDHFPLCCVLRFSVEDALMDGKTIVIKTVHDEARGVHGRGFSKTKDGVPFVPCGVLHRA